MKVKNNAARMTACLLTVLMVFGICLPVSAADSESTTSKEEVIYAMTNAAGMIKNVNAVNIFGSGSHTDYGSYTDVKMLTTDDALDKNGDTITFSTDAEKVYYQGTMVNAQIPWNISIRYYLDGQEYNSATIAGQTG